MRSKQASKQNTRNQAKTASEQANEQANGTASHAPSLDSSSSMSQAFCSSSHAASCSSSPLPSESSSSPSSILPRHAEEEAWARSAARCSVSAARNQTKQNALYRMPVGGRVGGWVGRALATGFVVNPVTMQGHDLSKKKGEKKNTPTIDTAVRSPLPPLSTKITNGEPPQ